VVSFNNVQRRCRLQLFDLVCQFFFSSTSSQCVLI
jgi:hypothetical protein